MDNLKHFLLPLSGMKNGIHTFVFTLDENFFKEFEESLIKKGFFDVKVEVDKRNNLIILHSNIKGYMETNCDRCLADIKLPLETESTVHVKTGNPEESDDEILFIEEEATSIHMATLLYECVHVAIPMIKVYDCYAEEVKPCNVDVLKHLNWESSGEKKQMIIWTICSVQ
ncbi:MAG: DUF177 domain-containing protein [Saprospiraceae bacterium]|nr:DUF177 domain-containing protein [Saprospiraceae bacterium]